MSCLSRILTVLTMLLITAAPCLAASGTINLVDVSNGGKLVRFSSQYNADTWAAANLIDEKKSTAGWSSAEAVFPQELVFAFKDEAPQEINKLSMMPFTNDIDVRWIKDFELLVSATTSAADAFTSVGKFRLELKPHVQDYHFKAIKARYIMIRVTSNWGSNRYAELAKIGVYQAINSGDELSAMIDRLEQLLTDLKAYRATH